MQKFHGKLALWQVLMLGLPLTCGSLVHAATVIDLSHQKVAALTSFGLAAKDVKIEETSRLVDANNTLHVRIKQTYLGHPVLAADGVMHIPNGAKAPHSFNAALGMASSSSNAFMNGQIYGDLQKDLANTPNYVFGEAQANKALTAAIKDYENTAGKIANTKLPETTLIVYVDKKNKAHWAYRVKFHALMADANALPAKPIYIMDAVSLSVYEAWNDLKTADSAKLEEATVGGFGGNKKMGKLTYDGSKKHLPVLNVMRDSANEVCYMQNKVVKVKKCTLIDFWWEQCDASKDVKFICDVKNDSYGVYWNGQQDAVNGGYSPSNDALFNGEVIRGMYQDWYDLPVLVDKKGKPLQLTMIVHMKDIDNAYWDDAAQAMNFGDGKNTFHPLTSLGVTAHEISHGFTSRFSDLEYESQSGGMNEAFSDMAAQAAEFYAYHDKDGWANNWQIGAEIFKEEGKALRYMDTPSKDCGKGEKPGENCSIDTVDQFKDGGRFDGTNVHYSSGIYNRVYYLMATTPGWDAKKAFDVMVNANMHYWTSRTDFAKGSCGVLQAATDLGMETQPILDAFAAVKVDTSKCEIKKLHQA